MFVLSDRVGGVDMVAALVGAAFLFGGIAQLVVAAHRGRDSGRGRRDRHLRVARRDAVRCVDFAAWYLIVFGIVHLIGALAGPKLPWWWTGLPPAIAELGARGERGALLACR